MATAAEPRDPILEALRATQRQYLYQKRLADSLLGLLYTLETDPHPEHVTNIALLTMVGQLVIRCAAYLRLGLDGAYHLTTLYGAHDPALPSLALPASSPVVEGLFSQRRVLDLDPGAAGTEPALWAVRHAGLRYLYPIVEERGGRGIVALGEKFSGEALDAHDYQIVSGVGIAIAVSWRGRQAVSPKRIPTGS